MEPKNELNENQSNPDHYKWGIFYYNKNDKRLFPPKRNKYLGWTVNFANPMSILALIALIVVLNIIISYVVPLLPASIRTRNH